MFPDGTYYVLGVTSDLGAIGGSISAFGRTWECILRNVEAGDSGERFLEESVVGTLLGGVPTTSPRDGICTKL